MSEFDQTTVGEEAILRGDLALEVWQALLRVASATGATIVHASSLPAMEQEPPPVTATLADFRAFVDGSKYDTTRTRYWRGLTKMASDAEQGMLPGAVPFTVRFGSRMEGADGRVRFDQLDVRSLAGYVASLDQWLNGLTKHARMRFFQDELPWNVSESAVDFWRDFANAKLAESDQTAHNDQ